MDLKGKKVAFLGDSITVGSGASRVETRYTNVFADITGCEVLNYGIGGTRIAKQKTASACSDWDRDFIERTDEMDDSADIVVVFGGTNDFGHGDAPFGKFSDDTEYTFYGALHVLYKKLINKYPDSEIVVITPLHRLTEDNTVNERGLERKSLKCYVEAIREVAEYYGLPVLDLYKTSGMQPAVEINRKLYMPDGLHPSDLGAAKIAERIRNFLSAL